MPRFKRVNRQRGVVESPAYATAGPDENQSPFSTDRESAASAPARRRSMQTSSIDRADASKPGLNQWRSELNPKLNPKRYRNLAASVSVCDEVYPANRLVESPLPPTITWGN